MIETVNISNTLKKLRKASDLSPKQVTEQLTLYGINISSKTLYGYESGLSMPNADTFLALCKIYRCENPLQFLPDEKKEAPGLAGDNPGAVEVEALREAMETLGYINHGEDLSENDLRFLFSIGESIRAWFERSNCQ